MIELIFILIMVELIAGLWLICKLNKVSLYIERFNFVLEKSGFTGNLTEKKLFFRNLNKHLNTFMENQKQKAEAKGILKIFNILLFSIPVIDFLFRMVKRKKHK